jgi:ADP-heptose:LPS heptosyltransferase
MGKAEDFMTLETLAAALDKKPSLPKRLLSGVPAPAMLETLKRGEQKLALNKSDKMTSPKQIRANFHTVVHHRSKPRPASPSPTSPEAVLQATSEDMQGLPAQSRFQKMHPKTRKKSLSVRPPSAPNILQEVQAPVKLIVHQAQSPGDILMLTSAIRDLHASYPGKFVTEMRTSCKELWENNPNQAKLDDNDPSVHHVYCEYPLINKSNSAPFHFIHGFVQDLESKLGLPIRMGSFSGDIHIADQEKRWYSQVYEILGKQVPFWIIDAGHKLDFTAKHWSSHRYQQVVDALPEITFVQIGAAGKNHNHQRLKGDNVIDLVGKTNLRQILRLMYNAAGVITPVSFPMHLSAAVDVHPWYKRKHRPCIVLGGGREPAGWEAYSNHQFIHTCGMLPCNREGGCWKSRTMPIGDGDKKDTAGLCERPVEDADGTILPQCMQMITPEQVVEKVRQYLRFYDYSSEDPSEWGPVKYSGFPEKVAQKRQEAVERASKK